MIAIVNQSDELVRLVDGEIGDSYGYHRRFGFISEEAANERRELLRRTEGGHPGAQGMRDEWLCRFSVSPKGFEAQEGCVVEKVSDERWRLVSNAGEFYILTTPSYKKVVIPTAPQERRLNDVLVGALCLLILAIGAGFSFMGQEELKEEEKLLEALAEQKTVVVPEVKVVQKAVETPPAKVVRKTAKTSGAASQNNLGFLKLLGKKELTKAVGGMPTEAKERSPGVGRGGAQGSGGELLTGLGKGLKKTTVGNTGVAGLGGIGDAGAGGGEGGFGTAYVSAGGSGGGKILSEGDLGKEMELDGGLDRVVIQATIAKYLSQVRACYEKGLRKNPGLTGQVLMDFEIAATGRLNYSRVKKTSLGNAEVENCVASVMKNWQFPKPVGGTLVKVNYPFTFKPSNYM